MHACVRWNWTFYTGLILTMSMSLTNHSPFPSRLLVADLCVQASLRVVAGICPVFGLPYAFAKGRGWYHPNVGGGRCLPSAFGNKRSVFGNNHSVTSPAMLALNWTRVNGAMFEVRTTRCSVPAGCWYSGCVQKLGNHWMMSTPTKTEQPSAIGRSRTRLHCASP